MGAAVLADPLLWADAGLVARETMKRARANVDALLEFLPAAGYRFTERRGPAFVPPEPDAHKSLQELEEGAGPVPLSLRAWWEEVGEVDLTGEHADWAYEYPDALVVAAPFDSVLGDLANWQEDQNPHEGWPHGFTVELSPDWLHKAGMSGGSAYSMVLPCPAADGPLMGERHRTTFVGYLRIGFAAAGLPGWYLAGQADWSKPPGPPPRELTAIASHMLPI